MKNARTQFHVTNSHLEHLNYMISLGGSAEERARFHAARVELLDTLGDLLNNPKIAKAWEDDEVNKRIAERNDQIVELTKSAFDNSQQGKEFTAQSKFQMNMICGLAVAAYVIVSALWVWANFHGAIGI